MGAVLFAALGVADASAWERMDEDLALVKRALEQEDAGRDDQSAATKAPARASASRKGQAQWFKVRIVDKKTTEQPVSISIPLAFLRFCADQADADEDVSDLLETLGSTAQPLVEIDSEDAQIRTSIE
jgi:hypothetical protein